MSACADSQCVNGNLSASPPSRDGDVTCFTCSCLNCWSIQKCASVKLHSLVKLNIMSSCSGIRKHEKGGVVCLVWFIFCFELLCLFFDAAVLPELFSSFVLQMMHTYYRGLILRNFIQRHLVSLHMMDQ